LIGTGAAVAAPGNGAHPLAAARYAPRRAHPASPRPQLTGRLCSDARSTRGKAPPCIAELLIAARADAFQGQATHWLTSGPCPGPVQALSCRKSWPAASAVRPQDFPQGSRQGGRRFVVLLQWDAQASMGRRRRLRGCSTYKWSASGSRGVSYWQDAPQAALTATSPAPAGQRGVSAGG
jgi:hypothetical protein